MQCFQYDPVLAGTLLRITGCIPAFSTRDQLWRVLAKGRHLLQYGWRNGAKFKKFIFIHIQCSYCYSRIYLFTFNNRIYIQEIYLFTFTCVFLIHNYICSHLRDVFIHIQRVISIHIHDRNIHSTFSAHHLCASVANHTRGIGITACTQSSVLGI